MRNDRVFLVLGIICLLGLGMLVASDRIGLPDQAVGQGFGESLWRGRKVDLMVQLGLVFVGALGIRALLPPEDDAARCEARGLTSPKRHSDAPARHEPRE